MFILCVLRWPIIRMWYLSVDITVGWRGTAVQNSLPGIYNVQYTVSIGMLQDIFMLSVLLLLPSYFTNISIVMLFVIFLEIHNFKVFFLLQICTL